MLGRMSGLARHDEIEFISLNCILKWQSSIYIYFFPPQQKQPLRGELQGLLWTETALQRGLCCPPWQPTAQCVPGCHRCWVFRQGSGRASLPLLWSWTMEFLFISELIHGTQVLVRVTGSQRLTKQKYFFLNTLGATMQWQSFKWRS